MGFFWGGSFLPSALMGCASSKATKSPSPPHLWKQYPLSPLPSPAAAAGAPVEKDDQNLNCFDIFDPSPGDLPYLYEMIDSCSLAYLASDQFHIMYELAGGSNGVIFCGQRIEDETPVAFKFFGYTDEEPSPSHLQAEIDLMISYAHLEALPKIFGYFFDSPTGLVAGKVHHKPYPVIVMELLDGVDLFEASYHRHLIASERSLSWLFRGVFTALQSLHDHRLIHRDIKLENLMLIHPREEDSDSDCDGHLQETDLDPEHGLRTQQLKIIDYGSMVHLPDTDRVYHDHTLVGTPGYIAPESVTYLDYSFQSDIWQVGCCLFSL
jgi:serine/threonine protein kinase